MVTVMVNSVTKGGTQKLPKKIRLSEPIDMTIHFSIQPFSGENPFSDFFFSKILSA
jgi:hypothetical protein